MYDKEPFSSTDETAMLELLYASDKTPDGERIDYFQLSNGNSEPVPRPFKNYLRIIANSLLPKEIWGDNGLNEPDFGSLNLDIHVDNESVVVKLGRKSVRLALLDDDGNIIEDDNGNIYREISSEAAYRWKNGPHNSRINA